MDFRGLQLWLPPLFCSLLGLFRGRFLFIGSPSFSVRSPPSLFRPFARFFETSVTAIGTFRLSRNEPLSTSGAKACPPRVNRQIHYGALERPNLRCRWFHIGNFFVRHFWNFPQGL